MQSANHRANTDPHIRDTETATPVRPEPFLPDRLYGANADVFSNPDDDRRRDIRTKLAEAFHILGRGTRAKAAYDRTRHFYRSGGRG